MEGHTNLNKAFSGLFLLTCTLHPLLLPITPFCLLSVLPPGGFFSSTSGLVQNVRYHGSEMKAKKTQP